MCLGSWCQRSKSMVPWIHSFVVYNKAKHQGKEGIAKQCHPPHESWQIGIIDIYDILPTYNETEKTFKFKKYCKTPKKDHHTKQDSNPDGQISNLVAPCAVSTPHSGVGMILAVLDSPALLALLIVVQMISLRQALHDNCPSSAYTPFLWYLQIPEDSAICFSSLAYSNVLFFRASRNF